MGERESSPQKIILFLTLGTLHATYTDFSLLCRDSRRPSLLLKTIRCAAPGDWTVLASLGISGPVQLLQFTTHAAAPGVSDSSLQLSHTCISCVSGHGGLATMPSNLSLAIHSPFGSQLMASICGNAEAGVWRTRGKGSAYHLG